MFHLSGVPLVSRKEPQHVCFLSCQSILVAIPKTKIVTKSRSPILSHQLVHRDCHHGIYIYTYIYSILVLIIVFPKTQACMLWIPWFFFQCWGLYKDFDLVVPRVTEVEQLPSDWPKLDGTLGFPKDGTGGIQQTKKHGTYKWWRKSWNVYIY